DAIQGLGVFPMDVKACNIDFLAADGHKWMMSPEGAGILYLKHEHLKLLRPLMVGAASVVDRHNYGHIEFALRDEASRYEGGSLNMVGLMAMGASLQMLMEWGITKESSRVGEAVLAITDLACQRLEEM